MNISAKVSSRNGEHEVTLNTNGQSHALAIAPKPDGFGSTANGGELLFLALATCYCNDIYREAKKRSIEVHSVEVDVSGKFGGPGEPAENITYRAKVTAAAPEAAILDLMRHTDAVAEIHNTLRRASIVRLAACEAHEA
jgi:organic hydroperoxide reductase OsmC/OhrA